MRTRHGDAMLLSESLLTRVVELAVHSLDLAAALDREPWLTAQAGGPAGTAAIRELGWDQLTFLRKVTGREPISPAEAEKVTQAGARWLTLG